MPKRRIERIAAVISIVSFGGSILVGGVQAIVTGMKQSQAIPQTSNVALSVPEIKSEVQIQEQEYEIVLKKEPNNQAALEGLVETRLQLQNSKGAIQPLEKLVQLHPAKQHYKTLLAQIKQQTDKNSKDNFSTR